MRTITLIGSRRFDREHNICNTLLTQRGFIVHTHGYAFDMIDEQTRGGRLVFELAMLEKIQQSDLVLVVDTFIGDVPFDADAKPYMGEETARELMWAVMQQVPMLSLHDLMLGSGKDASIEKAMEDLEDALTNEHLGEMDLGSMVKIFDGVTGRERVVEAQVDTKRDVTHAVLSYIADSMDHPSDYRLVAKQTLDFLDLPVMSPDQRNSYLAMVDPNSSVPREVVGG